MNILILEDDINRINIFKRRLIGNTVTVVTSASECIGKLCKNTYDLVFLDHDLGGDQLTSILDKNTGSEVARWMHDTGYRGAVIIHSFNPAGAQHMKNLVPHAVYKPGCWASL